MSSHSRRCAARHRRRGRSWSHTRSPGSSQRGTQRPSLARTHPKSPRRTNLHRTNLRRTNLRRTNLRRTNLRRTNLRRTNLHRTNLHRTNLHRTNLHRTNLRRTNLHRTNPHRTNPRPRRPRRQRARHRRHRARATPQDRTDKRLVRPGTQASLSSSSWPPPTADPRKDSSLNRPARGLGVAGVPGGQTFCFCRRPPSGSLSIPQSHSCSRHGAVQTRVQKGEEPADEGAAHAGGHGHLEHVAHRLETGERRKWTKRGTRPQGKRRRGEWRRPGRPVAGRHRKPARRTTPQRCTGSTPTEPSKRRDEARRGT
jgi:hypothetical protein